jgi:hypothetical protein
MDELPNKGFTRREFNGVAVTVAAFPKAAVGQLASSAPAVVKTATSFVLPTLSPAAVAAYHKLWGNDGVSAGTLASSSLKALCCGISRLGNLKRDMSEPSIEKIAAFWRTEVGAMNRFAHHMRGFLSHPDALDILTKVQELEKSIYDKRKALKIDCIKQVNPTLMARLEHEMESDDVDVKHKAWHEFRNILPEFWEVPTTQPKLGLPEGIDKNIITHISSQYRKQTGLFKDQTAEVWKRLNDILGDGLGLDTILDGIETVGDDLFINQHSDIMISPTKLAEFLRKGFMRQILEFAPKLQPAELEEALMKVEKETIREDPPEDLSPLDEVYLRRLKLLHALDMLPPLDTIERPEAQVFMARLAKTHSAESLIVPT